MRYMGPLDRDMVGRLTGGRCEDGLWVAGTCPRKMSLVTKKEVYEYDQRKQPLCTVAGNRTRLIGVDDTCRAAVAGLAHSPCQELFEVHLIS